MLTKRDLHLLDQLLDKKLEEKLTKKLDPIKKDINRIDKKLDTFVRFYDKEYISLERRVKKIEEHLGF